jgi:hypothetical protein
MAAKEISILEEQVRKLKISEKEKDNEIEVLKKYIQTLTIERDTLEAKVALLTQGEIKEK